MNRRKFTPGIIFIGLGSLLLLRNLGYLHWWTFGSLWRFWPLILVIIGINTIFHRSNFVPALTWTLFFALLIGIGLTTPAQPFWKHPVQISDEIFLPVEKNIDEVALNLNTGALNFELVATDQALLQVTGFPGRLEKRIEHDRNGQMVVEISSKNVSWKNSKYHMADGLLALNNQILWDLTFKVGAATAHMDLKDITYRSLDFSMGAGEATLVFGQPQMDTDVKINTGASHILLRIPRNANAIIRTDNVLTQTVMDDRYWVRREDELFSAGYDPEEPTQRIDIKIGVGRLGIESVQ
ncbi:LiaI-LiaF-like domain-containing protein [Anoxynatronum buryatiense]|uniref:LiaI-LiaF-like transmembrane region domain-containing protein n=1 Tax=Anoxynatronum buryatiense TaxID=489973 RepID=A0AA45WUH9_9CLOT|nr:DUF5668 domain-containing protein [Anoxynatronum buryatiense]SMP48121.1 hypothetical protein SAMN06296020_103212 [Anoxynatronum buryatiense]